MKIPQAEVLKFKSTAERVDTFLMDTFKQWGSLSPKSNVKITIDEEDEFEGMCIGHNIDTEEVYVVVDTCYVLIFPPNTLQVQ